MKTRILHFLNQYFAGIGGEDKADVPVNSLLGAVGPGKRLQVLLGDSSEIVVTAYCGDNYFSANYVEALKKILQIIKDHNINIVVAGPAFDAGRYGFSCIEVCHAASTSLGVYGISAMHSENPGLAGYKQYGDAKVFAFPTTEAVSSMEDGLLKMTQCISKITSGSVIGSVSEEGYFPRGYRFVEFASKSGAERGITMLLDKLAGRPFITEIPVANLEATPIPHRIDNLKKICISLVSTTGVVPEGNPDEFKLVRNNIWKKYSIAELNSMKDAGWDVVHGGYSTAFMYENPNYGVPLDACRQLEKEGLFRRLYPYYYGTSGCGGSKGDMEDIGRAMVSDMKAEGVDAVLLVST